MKRWILVAAMIAMGPATASADTDCLEVGWRDAGGNFQYYGAHIVEVNENRLYMRYDFKGGELPW